MENRNSKPWPFPIKFAASTAFQTAITLIYYPFYRTFVQIRTTPLQKEFNNELFKEAKNLVKQNGYYKGFASYWTSRMFFVALASFNLPFWTQFIGATILQYPFVFNSNLKALNLPNYTSLKNFPELIKFYSSKSAFKGFTNYAVQSLLMTVTFVNLLCHRIESFRLSYLIGPFYGQDFQKYKDAKTFMKDKQFLKPGRFYFTWNIHLYNFVFILCVMAYNGKIIDNEKRTGILDAIGLKKK